MENKIAKFFIFISIALAFSLALIQAPATIGDGGGIDIKPIDIKPITIPTDLIDRSGITLDNWVVSNEALKVDKIIEPSASIYPAVEVKNQWGLGSTMMNAFITKHTQECLINCKTRFEITTYYDSPLITELITKKFYEGKWVNGNMKEIKAQLLSSTTQKEVEDYGQVCVNTGEVTSNGTAIQSCTDEVIGTHMEDVENFIDYPLGTVMPSGTYTVEIEGKKNVNEIWDWQMVSMGKTVESWATWNSSFANGLVAYHKLDYNISNKFVDSLGVNNGTMNAIATNNIDVGKINNASNFTNTAKQTINITNTAQLQSLFSLGANNFTFGMWIYQYPQADTSSQGFLQKGKNAYPYIWFGKDDRVANTNKLEIMTAIDASNYRRIQTTNAVMADNAWYYVVFRYNGTGSESGFSIFVNGTSVPLTTQASSGTFGSGTPTEPVRLGLAIDDTLTTHYFHGRMDEVAFYNRSLSTSEISDLYNSGAGLAYLTPGVNVILNSPAEGNKSNNQIVTFNATAIVVGGATLVNMSLWDNSTGIWKLNQTNAVSGINATTTFTSTLPQGSTKWGVQGCSDDGLCSFSANQTVNVDTIKPLITIINPTGTVSGMTVGGNISLNYTISDTNLDKCWFVYDGTNSTISDCTKNSSFIYASGVNTITVWANDTFGNTNSSTSTWTPTVVISSQTYNTISYETAMENFIINVTGLSSAILNYNGTMYTADINGNAANKTLELPLLTNGPLNKTFNWILNSGAYNSSVSYQYEKNINFTICNFSSSINQSFLNITFTDEINLAAINMSLTLNPNYFLNGANDQTIFRSYYYNNATDNPTYSFCFDPASRNLSLRNMTIGYYSNGLVNYPLRTAPFSSLELSNNTYLLNLYGLSSNDGRYTQFIITDKTGQIQSGAEVKIETTINNVFQQIADLFTDTSGQTSAVWVNPTASHTLTISKTGCTSLITSLYPTSSSYTYQIDCGNSGVPLVTPYIGPDAGLQFRAAPNSGPVTAGNITFQLRVMSSQSNMQRIMLQLWTADGSLLYSKIENVSNISGSTCRNLDCYTNFTYDTSIGNYTKLKGKYYVDLGSGWFTLENDAYWTQYIIPHQNTTNNMGNFWRDSRALFDSWSSDNSSYDSINRAEFSRIFFIFLILALLLAAFNKMTGYDSANPGAFLILMTSVFLLGSMAGGAQPTYFGCPGTESYIPATHLCSGGGAAVPHIGFFYLYGLTPIEFVNNYIIAIYMILITITYILNVDRRSS